MESFRQTKDAATFCAAFLRRAVRYGRTLGFHEPFFFKLVDVVAETMGDVFPEVRAKQENDSRNDPAAKKNRLTRHSTKELSFLNRKSPEALRKFPAPSRFDFTTSKDSLST